MFKISPTVITVLSVLLAHASIDNACALRNGVSKSRSLAEANTLQLVNELQFSELFRDQKSQSKYEVSDVIVADNKDVYAVCDSSWSISKFTTSLTPLDPQNVQIGNPTQRNSQEGESSYEALFQVNSVFYAVRESILQPDSTYHAVIEEILVDPNQDQQYTVARKCPVDFLFGGDSKGFEGAIPIIDDATGDLIVLGLCEGNFCAESSRGRERGNGVIVALRQVIAEDGSCNWTSVRQISIPSTAAFEDYSGIALNHESGQLIVSSQENSQVWIGELLGRNKSTGMWNVLELGFEDQSGVVYDFPKNQGGQTIYCNIEGVHWLSNDTIIAVSDKMKSGKQGAQCAQHDESVHTFKLPATNPTSKPTMKPTTSPTLKPVMKRGMRPPATPTM
jgi:hypothetical protein